MKKPAQSPCAPNPSSRSTVKPAQKPVELTDDVRARVALKADELYEQRGRQDGRELDDWLQAERIITAELRQAGS